MFNEETYELIDGYLNNTLDPEDRLKLEDRLNNDSELLQEFIVQQDLFNTLEEESWAFEDNPNTEEVDKIKTYLASNEATNIANAIANANKEYQTSKKYSFSIPKLFYPIAASIVLLIGYFLFFENTITTEELYTEHKNWDDLPSLTSRADVNETANLAKGELAFKNKEYKEALDIFSNYLKLQANPQVTTYLGVTYIELEQYNLALETFNKLLNNNTLDSSKAFWYKVLIYLKLDDKVKAIETLDLLLEKESNYNYKLAKELKTELVKME